MSLIAKIELTVRTVNCQTVKRDRIGAAGPAEAELVEAAGAAVERQAEGRIQADRACGHLQDESHVGATQIEHRNFAIGGH